MDGGNSNAIQMVVAIVVPILVVAIIIILSVVVLVVFFVRRCGLKPQGNLLFVYYL